MRFRTFPSVRYAILFGIASISLGATCISVARADGTASCDPNISWSNTNEMVQKSTAFNECMRKADEARQATEKERQDRLEASRLSDQQISDAKALASDIATKGVVEAIKSAGNAALDRRIGDLMGGDTKSSDPAVLALKEHIDQAYDQVAMSDPVARAFASTSTEKTVNIVSSAQAQLEVALHSTEALGSGNRTAASNAISSFGDLRHSAGGASTGSGNPAWDASVQQAQTQAQQSEQMAASEISAASEESREAAAIFAERQKVELQGDVSQLIRQGEVSGWAGAAAHSSSGSSSGAASGAPSHGCEAIGPGHPMC